MSETLFTKIINGHIPAKFAYRDADVVAIYDIAPQAPVHILIIPVKPLLSLAQAEPADAALLGKMLVVARQLAEEYGLAESGYRLVANTGRDAGQSVPHLHFHLLGGRPLAWPPG